MSAPPGIEEIKLVYRIPAAWRDLQLDGEPGKCVRSPFRDEKRPSFSVYDNGRRWKDFASGESGDVFDFVSRANGTDTSGSLRWIRERLGFIGEAGGERGETIKPRIPEVRLASPNELSATCAGWLGTSPVSAPSSKRPKSVNRPANEIPPLPLQIHNPSDAECRATIAMAECLANDPVLCERLAKRRGWQAETLRQLALECYLGWDAGKLAFIYDTGVKLRWLQGNERQIRWAFGKPWLWRGAWLGMAETVYLCEGETDAISLIDAGVEKDGRSVVLAMPSASTFDGEWAPLFRGKDVVLCLDNDEAGRHATARVSKMLSGHVRSLNRIHWEGPQQNGS